MSTATHSLAILSARAVGGRGLSLPEPADSQLPAGRRRPFLRTESRPWSCRSTWLAVAVSFMLVQFEFPASVAAQPPQIDFQDFDDLMNFDRPSNRSPSDPAAGDSALQNENGQRLPGASRFTPLRPTTDRDRPAPFPRPFGGNDSNDHTEERADDRGIPFRPLELQTEEDVVAPPAEGGTERLTDNSNAGFQWQQHRTSMADLLLPISERTGISRAAVFDHGTPVLSYAEEQVYLQMLNLIDERRQALVRETARRLSNAGERAGAWERTFYQFEEVRRLAWKNGELRPAAQEERIGGLPDPFRENAVQQKTTTSEYDLLTDLRNFPAHFVGRPIVLEGVYQFSADVQLGATPPDPNEVSASTGPAEERETVALARGTLTSLDGSERIATVDARSLLTADGQRVEVNERPGIEPVPVLVKGWVVKQWNAEPLIYCETLRQISPVPHRSLITQYSVDRRALQDRERWLYYETIRQMQVTKLQPKQQMAERLLRNRITELMKGIDRQTKIDLIRTDELLQAGKITEQEHRQRKAAFQRRFTLGVRRYQNMLDNPEQFSTFVDLFQNPEVYHGRLVTLSGHVRHVVSYPGDETLFRNGQMLHELWLFTDDSQHNPTVIITPDLPSGFPTDAEVVDRVSVTGCFFKRYVYSSQDADRIAPLILAGQVSWKPTAEQINDLVADGHLSAASPLAKKASLISRDLGRTGGAIIAFCIVVLLMVLVGRAQREERDRVRLRKRINELPEFENLSTPGYALPVSDIGSKPRQR